MFLGENNLKFQSDIIFLLCVAVIQEYKSDVFLITNDRTFYECLQITSTTEAAGNKFQCAKFILLENYHCCR